MDVTTIDLPAVASNTRCSTKVKISRRRLQYPLYDLLESMPLMTSLPRLLNCVWNALRELTMDNAAALCNALIFTLFSIHQSKIVFQKPLSVF